ncbi:hypothetical protein KP509_07G035500 [Ceratopteris richardii]|uniref:Tify domain-containing protein n=1 Tax=Ceratopteris richardii TaxID=49495 RepID=A0A8T2UGR1_CERRI|nr:hypothetical protein KP509_07G035500 [Ceratopteris richardii]
MQNSSFFLSPNSIPDMRREAPDQLPRQDHPRAFPGRVCLEQNVPSELTIFYSGTVNVYSDVPADKVQAIKVLLSNPRDAQNHRTNIHCNSLLSNPRDAQNHRTNIHCTRKVETPKAQAIEDNPSPRLNRASDRKSIYEQPLRKESTTFPPSLCMAAKLPFGRAASLARFLEKRKDRLQSQSAAQAENENYGELNKKIKTHK